jgi:hypothetical protein
MPKFKLRVVQVLRIERYCEVEVEAETEAEAIELQCESDAPRDDSDVLRELVDQALAYERDAFEHDAPVDACGLVDFFSEWRRSVPRQVWREISADLQNEIVLGEDPNATDQDVWNALYGETK